MPTELVNLINLLNDNFLVYLIIFIIAFYLMISFFTWSLLKPLQYLGISNIVIGIVIIIIRLLLNAITTLLPDYIKIVETILPTALKPLLISGMLCITFGIIMIVVYYLINKYKNKNKEEIWKTKKVLP